MNYMIVTIEREYASGGREIGRLVAEALGNESYGEEILEMAAKKKGISPEYLEELEERASNSFFHTIYSLSKSLSGDAMEVSKNAELVLAEAEVIRALALEGSCVIIGHCAAHVLKNRKDVLNVFIHAGWESRKKRAVEYYNIPESEADQVLKRFDKRRSGYYSTNTGKKWNDPKNYHLMLDAEGLGLEACAKIIAEAAKG